MTDFHPSSTRNIGKQSACLNARSNRVHGLDCGIKYVAFENRRNPSALGGTHYNTRGTKVMPPPEVPPLTLPLRLVALIAVLLSAAPAATAAANQTWHGTIGSDLKAVVQPRTLTILAVGAVAAGASLTFEDAGRQAALFEGVGFDGPSDLGNEYGSGVTLAALSGLFLGAGHLAHDEELKRTGSEMFRSLAYSTVAVQALKLAFHRKRPSGGAYSFPSGHTATAFAVAPVLASRLGPRVGIPAFLLAGATGIGRMEDRKHYLSDVVFGAALGLSIGLAVSRHDVLPANLQLEAAPGGASLSYHF